MSSSSLRRLLVVLLPCCVLAGCGGGGTQDAQKELRTRAEQVRKDVERRAAAFAGDLRARRKRIIARVEEVLGGLQQTIPEAPATRPEVKRRAGEQTVAEFLTGVIKDIDAYWTKTLKAAGRPAPRVDYSWVAPGHPVSTSCGVADDRAAFYCPGDDTIYFAQKFAADLYAGVAEGLPGGSGKAAGSFGVAYVLAHEYGHDIQNELGLFRISRSNSVEPFELQADCLAGSWGNSAFAQGNLTDADVKEAIATVESVGDYDIGSQQHHGTPAERRDAWLTGFRSGDPAACTHFVPAV